MNEKRIHIYYINKIKFCDGRIYDAQDDLYVNNRVVAQNERSIEHWLDKAKIFDKDLRFELRKHCNWYNDSCCKVLEKLGWTIVFGIQNL